MHGFSENNTMKITLEEILLTARHYDASDIHLIAGLPPAWRVNGDIILGDAEPFSENELRALIDAELNLEQKKVLKEKLALCYSLTHKDMGRFRVSIYMRNSSPELAVRACATTLKTRQQLGLPESIDTLLDRPYGLILVTGATGSGKTTTMNYMLDQINSRRQGKIITIEDPIEFVHNHKQCIIVQQELHSDVLSFEDGLHHILRQDPDVIGVGEMRNLDTIETTLTAAETGHLVLATLHTSNAVNTIERIVGVFPPSQQPQVILQLSNCLLGIISQQLLPTIGNKGRVLAYELLLIDAAERNIIRENASHKLYTQIEMGSKRGMRTMDRSLQELHEKGLISYDTMLSHAADQDALKKKYNKSGI